VEQQSIRLCDLNYIYQSFSAIVKNVLFTQTAAARYLAPVGEELIFFVFKQFGKSEVSYLYLMPVLDCTQKSDKMNTRNPNLTTSANYFAATAIVCSQLNSQN
jgi:hypothetical protein